MKKMLISAFTLALAAGQALATDWTSLPRQVKYVEVYSSGGVQRVQIGTHDNYRFTYHSNAPECSVEGLKSVIAAALSARATGDGLHFYGDGSGTDWSFSRIMVGEKF